ncbi:divalent metal cation (Fe/Co/Zn/Cd) transporter [Streptosporangium becharense]|uniref:Divalent metal cation (Fe/Co/Zn/Cd) transporter n=1 Tax=Streptosporangium becharense TaxID=1816182 RepID=A0A7W9IBA4_9ACTN|nr:cation transporter [Streptosporangium becharense]MBB2914219.1 divalent metal cation (Fe/Co/Zn/Cd) transporter [Streptosporangium becharense]MBB5817246.1 divalent metal cation (Fe/Co/Zn/Cd) transporter [Streptosporangium becharense]
MTPPVLTAERRAALGRRSLHLAYATAGYNLLEGVVALTAGAAASSAALLGFGLDSFIEVSSAAVVIWQFRSRVPEDRERTALRLIAVSFFALAAWVSIDAVRSLSAGGEAASSPAGIALAAVSVVVMPLLVAAKRRTGRELGSATVVADSTQTMLCTYLSAVLLAGLALNAAFGWSWADPIAALVIAAVAVREGIEAWKGEQCDDCALPAAGGKPATGCGCAPGCADACCRDEQTAPSMRTGENTR